MTTPTAEFEPVTLANLADGKAEELFQEALADVSEVLEAPENYERSKDKDVRVVILLEVEIVRRDRQETISMDVRHRVKRPKRARVGRSAFYKAGTFTQPTFRQSDMFHSSPDPKNRH